MIVPLLALPDSTKVRVRAALAGVTVRRAKPWERSAVERFITTHFTEKWGDEAECAWARTPLSAFVAVRGEEIVGFAAYDCSHPGVFGPTGTREDERGRGTGAALFLRALEDMRARGYIYAIIGGVGPSDFYKKVCDARLLPKEWPSYVTNDT